jgi:hypothetical protein
MYLHVRVCMPAIAERLRPAYPALPERAGVGSIPVVYVVPLSHILGKLQLIPAGDHTVTTAPFPKACTAARTRAINWARQAQAASYSTSTLGLWSGPMITLPLPLEKVGVNKTDPV